MVLIVFLDDISTEDIDGVEISFIWLRAYKLSWALTDYKPLFHEMLCLYFVYHSSAVQYVLLEWLRSFQMFYFLYSPNN